MLTLSKDDSQKLKAISILIIVLHNFLHLTNGIGENEFKLHPERIFNLSSNILNSPIGTINYILSYFGWYFIVIFIFITAYGFLLKLKNNEPAFQLIIKQAMKTAILLFVGGIALFFLTSLKINDILFIIIRKIVSLDNFSYDKVYAGIGSWWYFGLFFQLCITIPIVYIISRKINIFILYIISYIIIFYIYLFHPTVSFFATSIGHIPEIIFAIQAIKGKVYFKRSLLLLSFSIFTASNFINFLFPFTYLSFLYIALYLYKKIPINISLNNTLLFIGVLSPFIFILNGPIRSITLKLAQSINFENSKEIWLLSSSLMHLFCVILVSILINVLLKKHIDNINNEIARTLTIKK